MFWHITGSFFWLCGSVATGWPPSSWLSDWWRTAVSGTSATTPAYSWCPSSCRTSSTVGGTGRHRGRRRRRRGQRRMTVSRPSSGPRDWTAITRSSKASPGVRILKLKFFFNFFFFNQWKTDLELMNILKQNGKNFDWTRIWTWDLWFCIPALFPSELSSP